MNIVLSLDIGTSKIAAAAFDCGCRENAAVVSAVNSATVDGLPTGQHEQAPEAIFRQCLELLRQLTDSGKFPVEAVKAVAISGQMHGVLLADEKLKPLTNLMTWCDQRATELTAGLDRSDWPFERTGCYLHPGYGGATLAALASEKQIPPGATALTIADYVAAKLCSIAATEPTHAASWGIMDTKRNCWDMEIVELLQIPGEVLPEIKKSSCALGNLILDIGLPPKVKVCSPLGDNQASFIGACGLENDALLLNLGTGGQISLPCQEFSVRNGLETRPMPFGNFLLVGASLCGGRSYALLKDFFRDTVYKFSGRELDDGELYRVMDQLAMETEQALTVDTRFAGTRLNHSIRGRIASIGVDNFTPAALSRGFMCGMIEELCGMVPPEMLKNYSKVMASGNAVRKSPPAQQLISEKLGLPCELTAGSEEAATGAALAAAKAMELL
jgi:sugar (pentulose or hexulose) kinase